MFPYLPSILVFLVPLVLIIHVVKTGRNSIWIWVIFIGSYVGAAAYIIVEILPEMLRGRTVTRAKSALRDVVDPARELRDAHKNLRINDSVDSRRKFADELLSHGRYDEAIEHYRAAMTGIFEHEPVLMLGVAKAQFAKGMFAEARQTLEDLMSHNPGFKSPERQLLYARTLEAEGKNDNALKEYEMVTRTFLATEAQYRYGSLLKRNGQVQRGNEVLQEVLNKAEISNAGFRREQREWIEAAKKEIS